MIALTDEIRFWIDQASEGFVPAPDEFRSEADGLIYCRKCGGRRQTVVRRFGRDGYVAPRVLCWCQQEQLDAEQAAERQEQRMAAIRRKRAQGLQDRCLHGCTFANDNGCNPAMQKARSYAANWKQAFESGTGLLLFGPSGTGKTFFAACIANELLENNVPVLMTNLPSLLCRLSGLTGLERLSFVEELQQYDLLILDDLGAEYRSGFALEQMYQVIDSRYRSRRPMIITTNLTLGEFRSPPDLRRARIYERILERCAPVLFDGENFRSGEVEKNKQTARELVKPVLPA